MPRTTDAPTDADLRAALYRLIDRNCRMSIPARADDDDLLLDAALDELAEARPVVAAARILLEDCLIHGTGPKGGPCEAEVALRAALAAREGGGEGAAPPR